jgi:hypothetical protein
MDCQARITRIEEKIDKICEVMSKIASIDEKLMTSKESMERLGHRIDCTEGLARDVVDRMHELEIREVARKHTMTWLERAIWIQFTGAVGMVFWYIQRATA